MTRTAIKAAMAAITAFTFAPSVVAAEGQQQTHAVQTRDLDLSSAAGLAELDRRIDRAARQVCGLDDQTLGTRIRSRDAQRCYDDAKSQLEERLAQIRRDNQLGG